MNSNNPVIFDLGGVILNLDYQRTIDAFKKLGLSNFEDMYTQASQNNIFDDYETGEISSQHFINLLLPYLPLGTSPNKVVHAWNSMILDFPLDRLELLDDLKTKRRTFLLSNTNELHLQEVLRSLSKTTNRTLESYFEKVYYSHIVNLRKPNSNIFEFVCREQKLIPSETLFIDDTIGHINGSNTFGLKGFHLEKGKTIIDLF